MFEGAAQIAVSDSRSGRWVIPVRAGFWSFLKVSQPVFFIWQLMAHRALASSGQISAPYLPRNMVHIEDDTAIRHSARISASAHQGERAKSGKTPDTGS